jgi:hypothetical protein
VIRSLRALLHNGSENERAFAKFLADECDSRRVDDPGWFEAENLWTEAVSTYYRSGRGLSYRESENFARAALVALYAADQELAA